MSIHTLRKAVLLSGLLCLAPSVYTPRAQAAPVALNMPEARQLAHLIDEMLVALAQKDIAALDPLFAPHMQALWSNGKQFHSAKEIKAAYAQGFYEFKHFKGRWMPDHVDISGNTAWMTGDLSWEAELIESGNMLRLSVRSSFIFQKSAGRWQIVYEHSSHRRSD